MIQGSAERDYRPISDYALIGDAHTAALVATDGSIDWCCWPRFDSPAQFCRLLDARKGGWFRIGPSGDYSVTRSYIHATNVLATTFETDTGRFRLTDFMPIETLNEGHRGEDVGPSNRIVRLIEGLSETAEVEISFRPTFDFVRTQTHITPCAGGAIAYSGKEALTLACPVQFAPDESGALVGRFRIAGGDRVWVVLNFFSDINPLDAEPIPNASESDLQKTIGYWREWWATCRYDGPYRELVRRSALILKLLTFEPTGAIIAAPTTSLPEEIGGVRNWDYRYTWLRDSSLILYALQLLGYHEESSDFFGWLDQLCIPHHGRLQIMYTVDGKSDLPEKTLEHLEGYRRSRPVRVGNAAYEQKQLDVYGEVLDAVYLYHERVRRPVRSEWWDEVRFLANQTVEHWREPDHGIWEVRGKMQHFLYSKLLCWVALDRAVRMGRKSNRLEDTVVWEETREEIRHVILSRGYNQEIGAFTQSLGGDSLDASALAIPLTGFLPATDERVRSTVEKIRDQLSSHGLVYRYLTEDGLPGSEATFALSSFWLVDNLALEGRVDEAREVFERIVGYASDLGLLAEEINPVSGELLGNYPQGFSHLALIRSALNIARAASKGAEHRSETAAERADHIERSV